NSAREGPDDPSGETAGFARKRARREAQALAKEARMCMEMAPAAPRPAAPIAPSLRPAPQDVDEVLCALPPFSLCLVFAPCSWCAHSLSLPIRMPDFVSSFVQEAPVVLRRFSPREAIVKSTAPPKISVLLAYFGTSVCTLTCFTVPRPPDLPSPVAGGALV